jgi:hypothetical protein
LPPHSKELRYSKIQNFRHTRAIKLQLTQSGKVASGNQLGLNIQSDPRRPRSSFNKLTCKETQPCSVSLVFIFAKLEAGAARKQIEF